MLYISKFSTDFFFLAYNVWGVRRFEFRFSSIG